MGLGSPPSSLDADASQVQRSNSKPGTLREVLREAGEAKAPHKPEVNSG